MGKIANAQYEGAMRVAILAYDQCLAAEIFGVADVLLIANRMADATRNSCARFDVAIVSAIGADVHVAGGTRISTQRPPKTCDLLVVPALPATAVHEVEKGLSRLKAEIALVADYAKKCTVAGVCGGAFLLAEAGVLAGRRATTAWPFAHELQRRYPDVRVDPKALLVRDGTIITTGAFSAADDLALDLVRQQFGGKLAKALAKGTLLNLRDSQAPYVDISLSVEAPAIFSQRIRRWLMQNLAAPYNLTALAKAFHTSPRTLLRRFAAEAGRSPLAELQELRVSHAKRLLETSGLSIAEIAAEVGYLDLSTFSRLFARRAGASPGSYRRQFGLHAAEASGGSRSSRQLEQ